MRQHRGGAIPTAYPCATTLVDVTRILEPRDDRTYVYINRELS